ncbi:metal ABC transporter ATP-binding protein [Candidatus Binatus sp.]|uniref:metal ABC transporter ATP-binding protein n=1 Tax=Candidatus Binatus sp. TaxID=2811406 RepID=UPI002F9506BE
MDGRGPDGSSNALEVERLAIRFGTSEIFRDVSFSVPQASSLAVIGPNGAGKTILFRALIGSLRYEGSIRWAAGTKLGYVPQKLDIERDLPITGGDFLTAKAAVVRAPNGAVLAALADVGLDKEILNTPIGALSGGQFQRLLVAFALIGNPNVLLLDEPAAGVDAPGQEQLSRLIRQLQEERGMTILLISHDLSVVYQYATNVLCLSRTYSRVGPPKTVLTPEVLSRIYAMPIGFHVHNVP